MVSTDANAMVFLTPPTQREGAGLGQEAMSVMVSRSRLFGDDLSLAEWHGAVPTLSLVQLIQQVLVVMGREGRGGLQGRGQHRRVPTQLHIRGSFSAGGVGG